MPEAAIYALVWHFGDSFLTPTWQWKDSAGVAKNITGYLASLKVRDSAGLELLHLDSDTNGGLSIPTGTDGKVVPNATPALMAGGSITNVDGVYEYDVQVKSADGSIVKTLTRGAFRVDKEITDV
jgi:hypothetical protein